MRKKEQIYELLEKLAFERTLSLEEWITVIKNRDEEIAQFLYHRAVAVRKKIYGNQIYIRGLIEFTNYCKNDCYYCGIRKSNHKVERYRLSEEEILECCETGYEMGFRTFVLQGGEDGFYSKERMQNLIHLIKQSYPDCAITLSIGEKDRETYNAFFEAGAERYLLRHETACELHYRKLHPDVMSLTNRKKCLWNLKEIGYQVGSGFMVGSPWQTEENLALDMMFLKELQPDMVGIGPFIPNTDTPFGNKNTGTVELTLYLMALIRLMLPNALIPATTALGTLDGKGREKGMMAGANVIMPNLSPVDVRKKYQLYDNKLCTGQEAFEGLQELKKNMEQIGYEIVVDRGDCRKKIENTKEKQDV